MTAFLAITSAIKAALTGLPALKKGKVMRGREVLLPAADERGIRINTLRHAGDLADIAGTHIKWQGDIAVTLMARASPAQDGEEAIDELLAAAWPALAGMAAPAGVAELVLDPLITFAIDEADQTVCTAVIALRAKHITTAADLLAAA